MANVVLLDGSIGQELIKRSGDRATPLWSTQVMIDHPDIVEEVHADYFRVGSTIATTNTYAVLRDRLERVGLEDQTAALTNIAVNAARKARKAFGSGRVAASLGPLFASYRPDICPPAAEAAERYAEPVSLMKDKVDILLIETMSSIDQADGALRAAVGNGLPVWLSLTVDDDDGTRLRSGEPLRDIVTLVESRQPDAILINCSRPESMAAALDVIGRFGKPFGAYANGFTRISEGFLKELPTVDALEQRKDLDPASYAKFAMEWVDMGATIVGGCCEIGPDHITELASRLRTGGHRII